MGTRGRYRNDDNVDLIERIRELEERLSKIERTNQLSSSAINSGNLYLRGGGLVVSRDDDFAQGRVVIGSDTAVNTEQGMIVYLQRSQSVESLGSPGSPGSILIQMTTVEGEDPGFNKFPTFQLFDKAGNTLIADTGNSRMGFSEPRLSYTWWSPTAYTTTTSGTFSGFAQMYWYQYHPHLSISVFVQNDVGTSSDVRVVDLNSGNVLISENAIAGTGGAVGPFPLNVDRELTSNGFGVNGSANWLEVQHRRSAGAGSARTLMVDAVALDLS